MENFNKKIAFLICFASFFNVFSQKNSKYYDFSEKTLKNKSFYIGESLKYKFSYGKSNKKGILTAGHGKLEVLGIVKKQNRPCYHIKASGGSTKFFSFFYEVNDNFETFLDTSHFVSLEFIRNIHEDQYKKNQKASFFRKLGYGTSTEKKSFQISKYTQDMLSALYACRTIPNEKIMLNDTIFLEIYNLEKDEMFPTYFVPIKKEIVNTKIGKLNTIKCKPHIQKSRIFSGKNETYIWLTDDNLHIPVKVETPIQVGSIYIEILSVENFNEN